MNWLCPRALLVVLVLVLAAAPAQARAATYRVDDSASLPRESTALLRWRDPVPSRSGGDTLEGTIDVALRLSVGAWLNQVGRLYLVLPEQGTPLVRLSWRTQGRLLPGKVLPGQRVLVYEGPIATPYLEERLELAIEASGSHLAGTQPVNFHFEIDVD
jgi:hypothetical protein